MYVYHSVCVISVYGLRVVDFSSVTVPEVSLSVLQSCQQKDTVSESRYGGKEGSRKRRSVVLLSVSLIFCHCRLVF